MANKVILACEECGARNYAISSKPTDERRLAMKKFCKHCKKHTVHRQTR